MAHKIVAAPGATADGGRAAEALDIAVERRNGRWYATSLDFDLAGMGVDREAARRDLAAVVSAYLDALGVNGNAASALRPVRGWRRWRLTWGGFIPHALLGGAVDRVPRRERLFLDSGDTLGRTGSV